MYVPCIDRMIRLQLTGACLKWKHFNVKILTVICKQLLLHNSETCVRVYASLYLLVKYVSRFTTIHLYFKYISSMHQVCFVLFYLVSKCMCVLLYYCISCVMADPFFAFLRASDFCLPSSFVCVSPLSCVYVRACTVPHPCLIRAVVISKDYHQSQAAYLHSLLGYSQHPRTRASRY
jgi:hypothetical protein